jgi:energy-coupling factor transporter ATP-binding protein EcfA2
LEKNHRLVILGTPGAGKSTLLHYLLLRLTHDQDTFIQEFPQLADLALLIPLYIRLADYAQVWRFHPPGDRSLADFLPKYLHQEYSRASTTFVQRQLEQGKIFLLFDGLDEIPDASLRHQVVEQIKVFTQTYPINRFIVTSRIVGYKEASLPSDYQPYTLADFSQEQIRLFTQRWCPAYELWVKGKEDQRHLQSAATKEADKLFQATQRNPGVKRLAANPLLLTLLALIQRQGIDLPSHRVELYDRCMTTLLDTWVKARGQSLKFSKNDITKILCPLAFWMHHHQAVGAIPEEELTQQIVRQLLNRRLARDEYQATERAEQFIRTFHDETGILVESGKLRYGFLHPTFEEYFAAKELVGYKEDERNQFIKEHLHDARWREVILLAAGIVGIVESKEEQVTELVQKAVRQAGSPFEEWLHRDLLFAGSCLADDVGVSVACEDEIIEQIVSHCLVSPYDSLRESFSDVLQAWNGTRAGKKAAHIVLSVFDKLEMISNGTWLATATYLQERFTEYYQYLVQEYQEEQIKSLHLWIKIILWKLQAQKAESIIGDASTMVSYSSEWQVRLTAVNALGELGANQPEVQEALLHALSDPHEDVRQAAASGLGELGAKEPGVLDALLSTLLEDPSWSVRRAAALALAGLPIDRTVIGKCVEKRLKENDPLNSKQFEANANIDALLFALQQVIGDV